MNIIIYLTTINFLMLGLLFFLSRSLEKYRESLDEFAAYLQALEEQMEGDDDGDNDTRTRTENAGE